jgi:TnpA family transposase
MGQFSVEIWPVAGSVLSGTQHEAPYVLDGLHHHAHQTDLRITEQYTDTADATDHVFGLCHLLGYRFASRIKDLKDRKLYTIEKPERTRCWNHLSAMPSISRPSPANGLNSSV